MSLCSPTRSGDQIEAKIDVENMVLVGILTLKNVARNPQSCISKTAFSVSVRGYIYIYIYMSDTKKWLRTRVFEGFLPPKTVGILISADIRT